MFKEWYVKWIKENSSERELKSGVSEIIVPLRDNRNDFIALYVEKIKENQCRITDDGYALSEAKFNSMVGHENMVKEILKRRCDKLSVVDGEIVAECDMKDIGFVLQSIAEGVIEVWAKF